MYILYIVYIWNIMTPISIYIIEKKNLLFYNIFW
jgi:hypothetical protein